LRCLISTLNRSPFRISISRVASEPPSAFNATYNDDEPFLLQLQVAFLCPCPIEIGPSQAPSHIVLKFIFAELGIRKVLQEVLSTYATNFNDLAGSFVLQRMHEPDVSVLAVFTCKVRRRIVERWGGVHPVTEGQVFAMYEYGGFFLHSLRLRKASIEPFQPQGKTAKARQPVCSRSLASKCSSLRTS